VVPSGAVSPAGRPLPAYLPLSILLVGLLIPVLPAAAQGGLEAGFGPAGTFPTGVLDAPVGESGAGLLGEADLPLAGGRLRLGISLGWSQYARYRRTILYEGGSGEPFEVEELTGHDLVLGHLYLRRTFGRGLLRPHLEALAGFLYPYTSTELSGIRADEYDPVGSSFHRGSTALSGGLGLGFGMYFGRPADPEEGGEKHRSGGKGRLAALELRLRWIGGGRADWIRKGSVRIEGGEFHCEVRRTTADLLQPSLLFRFRF
jgi:hypothetical protein